jgi:heat shock protein HslJ
MQSNFCCSVRGLRFAVTMILAGALAACKGHSMEPSNEVIFEVNSYRVPCVGVGPMSCLQIRRDDQLEGKWQTFYSEIRGFEYRPGYLYRLRVRETRLPQERVPADASSIQFDLVEVIDKTPDPRLAIHDIWALVQTGGPGSDDFDPASVPEHPYIEFNVTRSAYLGNTGCGEFNGNILSIGPQELRLGPMTSGPAQPDCDDGSVTARWSAALEKVAGWHRNKLTLVLLDSNGSEVFRFRKID